MKCATSRPSSVERYDLSFTASRIIFAASARVNSAPASCSALTGQPSPLSPPTRGGLTYPEYWGMDDFMPVADALDQVFKELKWSL